MRKSFLPLYLFLLLLSLADINQIKAQSCCPEFELQFARFNCETPDCKSGTAGQPGLIATMCQYSTNKIQVVPGITPGFTYAWSVTGGTINGNILTNLSTPISYIDVTWGNGTLGTVTVTIYNSDSSCFKVLTQNFCLTKSPKALFTKNTGDTVCKNQAITFTNTSLGVYTNWYWDFGDGNTQNGGMSVSHAYSNTGTYVVSLTVSNAKGTDNCGCSNTYFDTITVDNSTGLQILTPDCRKMLCAGDTVTYCSSITGCSSYNWTAIGGTVIGTGSCIQVVWNLLTPSIINPTVTLTIPAACAGSCGNTTSLTEKILYNGMPIQGNNIVCENAASTYTLPTLPGVFYTWSVLPATGFTIINGTYLNTPSFGLIFTAAGSYTIRCDYIDSLRNCQGTSFKTIDVRPAFSIVGPATSCVSCNSVFTTFPSGNFNWNINTSPATTAIGPGIANTWSPTQTGTFTVTATQIGSVFCNSPQQAIIVVAPLPVLTIAQSANIACPGTVVKFWVTSTVNDMPITWTYPGGTTVLSNTGPIQDTITLSFTGTGPYTVTATQQCIYTCAQTSVNATVNNPPPPVLSSPQTTVCIDQVVSYAVTSPSPGIIYTWSITNSNLGTIQSGQGTPNVTILWHGNATNSGVLSVSHCGGTASANITVTLPMAVSITKTGNCLSNGLGYTLTANPAGQTYLWSPGGATTQSITALTAGVYTVTVTPIGGGCPVTKSITILLDGYRYAIAPPCIVTNCNLSSFSIPLSQKELVIPCAATIQWYFKPVGGTSFTPIFGANSANYNATQLGCYKSVATCPNGCNVTSNVICIPEDIYFCCTTPNCSSITFGIDFSYTGCNPTAFTGFYTGTGTPTGGFPINYCYGDGSSESLPTLNALHQYPAAGQYTACISTKTLVFNAGSGLNDTCCISRCSVVDVPVVANISASYDCNTGILSMNDASTYYPNATGATYTWTISGGTYTGTLGNTTSESVIPTSNGSFVITLSVTKGSCTSTTTALVPVFLPNAAFTVNPNPTCSKDITYFIAAPGYASYHWKFGDGSYSYLTPTGTPQHQYTNNTNAPINFIAKLIVTTPDGCIDSTIQIVTVHPKPIVTVIPNPSSICRGGSVTLTASINPNGNTMCSMYNYQWIKDGVNISGANSSTYSATDYGLYSVFVSGSTPGCNCTMLSDTAVVKLYPDPIANIETSSTVCFDPAANPWSFSLNATNYAGYTYNWSASIGGITFSPNGSTSGFTTATGTLVNNTNFVIYLQVVDANGCIAYDSLCIYTYKNPDVNIAATGTLCANSLNTINVVSPNINNNYTWNTGASGTLINTTIAGTYYATATNLLTGCSAFSNIVSINPAPSLQLFPIGCDTICVEQSITIPLAQLPNLSNYYVEWYDGIKPAGTLIYSGNGAITIPGNFLSLGLHHLWTTVSFPNSCFDSSGVFDVFVKNCCNCDSSSWAYKQFSVDSGATYQNLPCGNQGEIVIGCNTLIVNAAYNCSPSGCGGIVTGEVLDNLGNVIQTITSFPWTYTPVPGTNGNFFIKLIGWCDGIKCDSCITPVFYNCPLPEPPCDCDTAFHFTGLPTIVIPHIDNGFVSGGNVVTMNCGTTYPNNLFCQANYQFYINYQHPWPSGNCPTMVVGEVLDNLGNVIFTQNNVSQANPINYVFPVAGTYCVRFKLMVGTIVCDSCTICFTVVCNISCNCNPDFRFTGNPVINANLPGGTVSIPSSECNTSLATPLTCNTSYSFYINYQQPWPAGNCQTMIVGEVLSGATVIYTQNNISQANPLNYVFTSGGIYCVRFKLIVNGVVCDVCTICVFVNCDLPCTCNPDFHFTGNPVIITNYPHAIIDYPPPPINCNTSLEMPLTCNVSYGFYYNFTNPWPNGNCQPMVMAEVLQGATVIYSQNNVTQANPLNYVFTTGGTYCVKFKLMVNGIVCDSCTICFTVICESPCTCNPNFHFTGNPVITANLPGGAVNIPSSECNTSLATPFACNTSYSFYINYLNPWPVGDCQTMIVGEVLSGANVIYTQNNISQASPLNYTFTTGGIYCIRFKLIVNGVVCDVCTICVFVNCDLPCVCNPEFHFTGNPVIITNYPHAFIDFPPPAINCNTSLANPLTCNISYGFYYNFTNPWPNGNCETMVVAEVLSGTNVIYTQNNVSQANPLNYVFTSGGTYCVRFKLMVNGIVCDSCTICFTVICENPCTCNPEFHFTGNPVITAHLQPGNIKYPPPINCNTSLAAPFMCNTNYSFYYNFTNPYPATCDVKDSAVIMKVGNPFPLAINPNTSIGNPLNYTFTQPGTYCVKFYLVVNGQVCDVCTVCFSVPVCNPIYIPVDLVALLEGFMDPLNPGVMVPNLHTLGLSQDPTACDTVTVNLTSPAHTNINEYPNPDHTLKAILHTNGTASLLFPAAVSGNPWYISVKHRNHMETWSKLPVSLPIPSNAPYNFTSGLAQAYDDGVNPPMAAVAGGKFAFYGGDVNQDYTVDGSDANDIEIGANNFDFGYNASDANGDGETGGQDANIVEINANLFLFYARPY